jgi:hypothetical protein
MLQRALDLTGQFSIVFNYKDAHGFSWWKSGPKGQSHYVVTKEPAALISIKMKDETAATGARRRG